MGVTVLVGIVARVAVFVGVGISVPVVFSVIATAVLVSVKLMIFFPHYFTFKLHCCIPRCFSHLFLSSDCWCYLCRLRFFSRPIAIRPSSATLRDTTCCWCTRVCLLLPWWPSFSCFHVSHRQHRCATGVREKTGDYS